MKKIVFLFFCLCQLLFSQAALKKQILKPAKDTDIRGKLLFKDDLVKVHLYHKIVEDLGAMRYHHYILTLSVIKSGDIFILRNETKTMNLFVDEGFMIKPVTDNNYFLQIVNIHDKAAGPLPEIFYQFLITVEMNNIIMYTLQSFEINHLEGYNGPELYSNPRRLKGVEEPEFIVMNRVYTSDGESKPRPVSFREGLFHFYRFQEKGVRDHRLEVYFANDSRVRIRRDPSLESPVAGHLAEKDMVLVISTTPWKLKIGNIEAPWREIFRPADRAYGWSYGHFLDKAKELAR